MLGLLGGDIAQFGGDSFTFTPSPADSACYEGFIPSKLLSIKKRVGRPMDGQLFRVSPYPTLNL